MRICRDIAKLPDGARHTALAIGNFDGVHLGHQAIIQRTLETARSQGMPPAVMTFEPHPREFFNPALKPLRLQPIRAKARRLAELGVVWLFPVRFNRAFTLMTAAQFVEEMLVEQLAARHVIVGHDFTFGHQRQGNTHFLAEKARELGFALTIIPPIRQGEEICSSTRIREHIRAGDVHAAAAMLGGEYEIEGRVAKGDQRGRTLGFPTANIAPRGIVTPRFGVYAARAGLAENGKMRWLDAVVNIGVRPTFGSMQPLVEAHLLGFSGEIYGKRLRLKILRRLRDERKFDSAEALKEQITLDIKAAGGI